jgi:hypothetical protein
LPIRPTKYCANDSVINNSAAAGDLKAINMVISFVIIRATDRSGNLLHNAKQLETARFCLPVASFPDPLKISRDELHHSTC